MSTDAYSGWIGVRRERLNELFAAHNKVGGSLPGRRTNTGQLNWALILRLSAEFQGFARDLHDEVADAVITHVARESDLGGDLLRDMLGEGRAIDHGNVSSRNLGKDFRRFGLELWATMEAWDRRTEERRRKLEALVRARNAIAHDDPAKLAQIQDDGTALNLRRVHLWKGALDGLATTMDRCLCDHLRIIVSSDRQDR